MLDDAHIIELPAPDIGTDPYTYLETLCRDSSPDFLAAYGKWRDSFNDPARFKSTRRLLIPYVQACNIQSLAGTEEERAGTVKVIIHKILANDALTLASKQDYVTRARKFGLIVLGVKIKKSTDNKLLGDEPALAQKAEERAKIKRAAARRKKASKKARQKAAARAAAKAAKAAAKAAEKEAARAQAAAEAVAKKAAKEAAQKAAVERVAAEKVAAERAAAERIADAESARYEARRARKYEPIKAADAIGGFTASASLSLKRSAGPDMTPAIQEVEEAPVILQAAHAFDYPPFDPKNIKSTRDFATIELDARAASEGKLILSDEQALQLLTILEKLAAKKITFLWTNMFTSGSGQKIFNHMFGPFGASLRTRGTEIGVFLDQGPHFTKIFVDVFNDKKKRAELMKWAKDYREHRRNIARAQYTETRPIAAPAAGPLPAPKP